MSTGVTYANGFVQETVVVNDSTVTVGAREAGLRKQILATARGGETCMANLAQRPRATPGPTREGRGDLLSAEVCAYRRDGTADYWLSYAQVLDPADAEAAFAGAEDAEPSGTDCDDDPSEFVVLRATYEDPAGEEELERVAVFEMGCGGTADLGNGDVRVMTPAAVAPWSRNGIPPWWWARTVARAR